jgi:hypothetical protein
VLRSCSAAVLQLKNKVEGKAKVKAKAQVDEERLGTTKCQQRVTTNE